MWNLKIIRSSCRDILRISEEAEENGKLWNYDISCIYNSKRKNIIFRLSAKASVAREQSWVKNLKSDRVDNESVSVAQVQLKS